MPATSVRISPEAARFVAERGGGVWVWLSRPPMCCWGTPSYVEVATEAPGLAGFERLPSSEAEVYLRPPAGRVPDLLEIELRGKRRPRLIASLDGLCAITARPTRFTTESQEVTAGRPADLAGRN